MLNFQIEGRNLIGIKESENIVREMEVLEGKGNLEN
jgi:hypothetical protein